MTRGEFDALCEEMPGAVRSGTGELDSWKVGGKMFACYGDEEAREDNTEVVVVAVADAETAQMLMETGVASDPPYFRGAWVELTLANLDADEARHRIENAYDRIRNGLTKKVQATLPDWEKS